MAGLIFNMKANDTRPPLQIQVFNPDGSERDLTGHVVTFVMRRGDDVKVDAAMTPVVQARGIMEYQWDLADTDTVGEFQAEVVIDGNDTYPKDGYITVIFSQDLA